MHSRHRRRVNAVAADLANECGLDRTCLAEAVKWLLETAPADRLTSDPAIKEAIEDAAALHTATRSTVLAANLWVDLRVSLISTAKARFPGVDAEDLVEDTVCDILNNWRTFRFEARLRNWGRSILFHRHEQHIRVDKAARRGAGKGRLSLEALTEQGLEVASALGGDDPHHVAEDNEFICLLLGEIKAACRTARQRGGRDFKIGLLKFVKGLSGAEIGDRLGISEPTVSRVVARIKRHLARSPELVHSRRPERMKDSAA